MKDIEDTDSSFGSLEALDELLPQGVANDTRLPPTAEPLGELDALDALLAESVTAAQVEVQHKKDMEARKRGYQGMSKEEVEFCNTRMRAFEMAREWDADRCIAVFIQYVCQTCDTGQTIFSRLMEHHQHRRVKTTRRWVTVKESKLPLETVWDQKEVIMCPKCAVETLGMDDPQAEDIPYFEDVIDGTE